MTTLIEQFPTSTSKFNVAWSDLLFAFSEVMDMASPSIHLHQLRTAYIALRVGTAGGLNQDRLALLFAAAALHDIGALAPEEKVGLHDYEQVDPDRHCRRGAYLFEQVSRLAPAAAIIRNHHQPWHQWQGTVDSSMAFEAEILALADTLERSIDRDRFILHQAEALRLKLKRQGEEKSLARSTVDLFQEISSAEAFWFDLISPTLPAILKRSHPVHLDPVHLDEALSISRLFSSIIDFRSPFTATHTAGVGACSSELARIAGLRREEQLLIRLGANFHDIGKLCIPDSILMKPGPLTVEEYAVIKEHVYHTHRLLSSIPGMDDVTPIAAYHHERLDGNGYPFRLQREDLPLGSRIMAVADVYTALAEDRPYRSRLSDNHIAALMREMVQKGQLDGAVVESLLDNAQSIRMTMVESQALWTETYHNKFELL